MQKIMSSGCATIAEALLRAVAAMALVAVPAVVFAGNEHEVLGYRGEDVADVAGILVKPKAALAEGELHALLARFAAENLIEVERIDRRAEGRWILFFKRLQKRSASVALGEQLRLTHRFETVHLSHAIVPNSWPNDADLTKNDYGWELRDSSIAGIRAESSFDIPGGTRPTALIAMLDTGLFPDAEIHRAAYEGWDFYADIAGAFDPGDSRPGGRDDPCGMPAQANTWHGNKMTSLVAAISNNGKGIASLSSWPEKGLTPNWVPVRIFGRCGSTMAKMVNGIRWSVGLAQEKAPAHAWKARVISISYTSSQPASCDPDTQAAINYARQMNAVVVVSAGNNGKDATDYTPANCDGVIVVTAHDQKGKRLPDANFGDNVTLSAPGAYIVARTSTSTQGGYQLGAIQSQSTWGTSPATALVAATIGRMIGNKPALKPDDVERILKDTARQFPASCPGCGSGMLDAEAAIDATVDPFPSRIELSPASTLTKLHDWNCPTLTATVYDQRGDKMPKATVAFTTSTPSQLSVNAYGPLTARACGIGLGAGRVQATGGKAVGTANVQVLPKYCPPSC